MIVLGSPQRQMTFILQVAVLTAFLGYVSAWSSLSACQPMKKCFPIQYNLKEISRRTWYETWRSININRKCIVRDFRPRVNTLLWKERSSCKGKIIKQCKRTYRTENQADYSIFTFDEKYFYQFLATDNVSWILLLICRAVDKCPTIRILQSDPSKNLTDYAEQRIMAMLARNKFDVQYFPTCCQTCALRTPRTNQAPIAMSPQAGQQRQMFTLETP